MGKYNFQQISNCYLTPPELVEKALKLINKDKFDLDTCCSEENIPANEYYKELEHNGLTEPWKQFNWCNPPFDTSRKWVHKAYTEQFKGNTTVMLLPVRTETAYWHDYILYNPNVSIFWLRKGPKFLNAETKQEMGVFKNALALVIFKGINVHIEK